MVRIGRLVSECAFRSDVVAVEGRGDLARLQADRLILEVLDVIEMNPLADAVAGQPIRAAPVFDIELHLDADSVDFAPGVRREREGLALRRAVTEGANEVVELVGLTADDQRGATRSTTTRSLRTIARSTTRRCRGLTRSVVGCGRGRVVARSAPRGGADQHRQSEHQSEKSRGHRGSSIVGGTGRRLFGGPLRAACTWQRQ